MERYWKILKNKIKLDESNSANLYKKSFNHSKDHHNEFMLSQCRPNIIS